MRRLLISFGLLALALGLIADGWLVLMMIDQLAS